MHEKIKDKLTFGSCCFVHGAIVTAIEFGEHHGHLEGISQGVPCSANTPLTGSLNPLGLLCRSGCGTS